MHPSEDLIPESQETSFDSNVGNRLAPFQTSIHEDVARAAPEVIAAIGGLRVIRPGLPLKRYRQGV